MPLILESLPDGYSQETTRPGETIARRKTTEPGTSINLHVDVSKAMF